MHYEPQMAVLTTQSVLDGMRIIHVYYHSTDGFWEFLPEQDYQTDDLRLVSMKEIVDIEPELLSVIIDMSDDEAAIYDAVKTKWIIMPFTYND